MRRPMAKTHLFLLISILYCALLLPSIGMAAFKIQSKVKDYLVEGNTFEELKRTLHDNAPDTEDPRHKGKWHGWLVKWRYGFRQTPLSCRITDISIDVTTEIPKATWKGYDQAPKELQEKWDHYQEQLTKYQQSHIDFAINAGKSIDKRLSKLGTNANCTMINTQAEQKANKVIDRYKEKHHKYDKETQFGDKLLNK